MQFVQNFPFFSILLTLICAVITSVLRPTAAKRMTRFCIMAVSALNLCILCYTLQTGESYVYMMGHFPAPWGNEIRVGVLETVTMVAFCAVMFCSFIGGERRAIEQVEHSKYNIYCILVDLSLLALQALVYTNDLFTAYVFIEIQTLAAAGLVMMRQNGRSLVAGVRYMMMNLLGSSLFLIASVLLYTTTGHLLMSNIQQMVAQYMASGAYRVALTVVVALFTVGLTIKCALFPFDFWLPGAYSNTTATASAILSSLVSKGYIFMLVKVYYRVIGIEVIRELGILNILFVFGAIGMIIGSIEAVRAKTLRLMIAYSSVAQIGYIFMALGLGIESAIVCALWHLLAHAATKSMLFIAGSVLDGCTNGTHLRSELTGGFYRCPIAGLAFAMGAVNLVGVPMFSVFITKVSMAQAAVAVGGRHMLVAMICMAISTLLNAEYLLGTTVKLFTPRHGEAKAEPLRPGKLAKLGLLGFIVLNLMMSFGSSAILDALTLGLRHFG